MSSFGDSSCYTFISDKEFCFDACFLHREDYIALVNVMVMVSNFCLVKSSNHQNLKSKPDDTNIQQVYQQIKLNKGIIIVCFDIAN